MQLIKSLRSDFENFNFGLFVRIGHMIEHSNEAPIKRFSGLTHLACQFLIKLAKKHDRDDYVNRLRIVRNEIMKRCEGEQRAICFKCEYRISDVILTPCQHMFQCSRCYVSGTRRCGICASLVKYAVQVQSKTPG